MSQETRLKKYKNNMLVDWISRYAHRHDTFSKAAHEKLFAEFQGKKTMYVSNERSTK